MTFHWMGIEYNQSRFMVGNLKNTDANLAF